MKESTRYTLIAFADFLGAFTAATFCLGCVMVSEPHLAIFLGCIAAFLIFCGFTHLEERRSHLRREDWKREGKRHEDSADYNYSNIVIFTKQNI